MRLAKILRLRLRSLFAHAEVERELDEELQYHLHRQIEANMAAGMDREEARRGALRSVHGFEQRKEECREMRGLRLVDSAARDVRFALRQLRKSPAFALTAILILALGSGAAVSIFAVVDAALIQPLPYRNPARLAYVTESTSVIPRADLSLPDYLDWKRLNQVFSSLNVWTGSGYLLQTHDGAQPVAGARVSDGFFRTLGVTPILGRDFRGGEDLAGAPRTVILNYAAWQKRYGGRRDVIGRPVTLNGELYTIIGVLPRSFQFAPEGRAEFWATLHPAGSCDLRRSCHSYQGIARLKDGVTVSVALADIKSIAAQLERQYPDSNRGQGAVVLPLSAALVGDIRPILLVLLGGAGLLLAIACINVASLLLARSERRKHEIALRGALGASRARLVGQFVTEGLVLVAAGGGLGLLAAESVMQALRRLIPAPMMAGMPYLQDLGMNGQVLAFAGAIFLLAAVLLAVPPIFRLPWSELREGLAEHSRVATGAWWRRFGSHLVVAELAVAVVLLVGAGLLGKSLYRLLHVDLGFEPDHLATLELATPTARYANDAQLIALGRRIVSRVASLPGVKSVAITTRQLPVSFNGNTDWIRFVGRPYDGRHNEVNERDVSAAYFTTLRAKLLRGRYFTDAEDESKPEVVIINQALARKYFPGGDPIGKQIGDTQLSPNSIREIIGVVANIREGSLEAEIWPTEYLPFNQSPGGFIGVLVGTEQAPQSLLATLQNTMHQIDPGIGIAEVGTMSERIGDSETAYLHRASAWLVGAFAALALLLGVVGLYGVIAYAANQRTREIAVRMALGAERGSVYKLILAEAAWLTGIGIGMGIVGSLAAATLMRAVLFGTQPWDGPTLAAVAALLAASALLASYLPARRAASVNPIEALRAE